MNKNNTDINKDNKENQNLKNIFAISQDKLHILKEILDISLKIKDSAENACLSGTEIEPRIEFESQAESVTDGAIENIAALVDFREELIGKLKDAELSLKHYSSKLNPQDLTAFTEFEKNFSADAKIVLDGIKAADETNSKRLAELMSVIKEKIKSVKENRNLMDKYVGGNSISSAGTLLSEKK